MYVATVKAGALEDDGLEELLIAEYPELVRLAFLILHNSAEAEDATQVALERAWRARAQLNSAESGRFWLRRIVAREALRSRSSPWRRLRSSLNLLQLEPSVDDGAAAPDITDVVRAFEHLPTDQSAALALHYYLGYSVAEIAQMLALPTETVRSRLRLGMRRVREELKDA